MEVQQELPFQKKCLFCEGGTRHEESYPYERWCAECSGTGTIDPDKYEEHRLKRKFGHFWAAYFLTNPFDPNSLCYCCDNKATTRIEANIWGTIHQYDTCDACAEKWDGVRTDGLPERERRENQRGAG